MLATLVSWFDTARGGTRAGRRTDWVRVIPLIGLHVACLAVLFVGVSPVAVVVAVASYLLRMFAITAFYHRYFSHRAFRTSCGVQFVFALIGAAATQRGPCGGRPTTGPTTVTLMARGTHTGRRMGCCGPT